MIPAADKRLHLTLATVPRQEQYELQHDSETATSRERGPIKQARMCRHRTIKKLAGGA